MHLTRRLLLTFGLLILGQSATAFNVCRSKEACDPTNQCCARNCVPLFRKDCDSCPSPPCRCVNGECLSTIAQRSLPSDDGSVSISERSANESLPPTKRPAEKWPDILLIAIFALIVAASLASVMLWAYVTFRDTKRIQQDEAVRKEEHRKAAGRSSSQTSLKAGTPVKRASSRGSKEVVKVV